MNNKQYFEEQHFNLKNIREKNINKIENYIKEKEELNKRYASLKRDVLVRVNSAFEGKISQKELDKKVEERFSKLEQCLEKERINIENKIRAEIIHQSKMLLVLKKNEDIYNYYKLITEKPMPGNYAELEQRLYRETLMKNPAIENIIISFSELDVNNNGNNSTELEEAKQAINKARTTLNLDDLNNAIRLVNALPDGKEKQDLQNEIIEIANLIDNKRKFDEVRNLLDQLEVNVSKGLWEEVERKIDELPECYEKEQLKERIQKLYNENEHRIYELLTALEEEIKNNEDITDIKFDELIERYETMVSSSLYVVNDNDLENRIKEVIMYKNAIVEEERQENDAINNPEKIGLKARFLEFFGFPVNAICRSKLYGKILKNKKEKAESKNNDKLVQKYEQRSKDRDIISGVRLYQSKDKLSKLKTKLYTDGLSKYGLKSYNKSSNSVSNRLYFGITRAFMKEYDSIINDRTRTISYADQAMEMLAVQNVDDNDSRFSEIKKFLNIPTSEEKFNSRVEEVTEFLDDAKDANTLTEEEVLAYKEEIDNIVYYKNIYSNNSCKYVDSDVHEIINNKDSSLPYIKTI